jgi:hypothetical protein
MILWLVLHSSTALLGLMLPISSEADTLRMQDQAVADAPPQEEPAVPSTPPAASSHATDNCVRLYFGQRMFDEDFWSPLEDQLTFGLEFTSENPSRFIGWEAGAMYSFDDDDVAGFDVEASSWELYGGIRKTFLDPDSVLRPYLGAGLAWITGDVEVSGLGSDDDDSFGAYLHGGLDARVTESLIVGADLRSLVAT